MSHCAAFFKDLASLTDRYRPLAPLIHRGGFLARTDRAAAFTALLEHRAKVPPATGTGGQPTAQRTLITAQMFGVRGPPS